MGRTAKTKSAIINFVRKETPIEVFTSGDFLCVAFDFVPQARGKKMVGFAFSDYETMNNVGELLQGLAADLKKQTVRKKKGK